jgi:uncharacterized RDD family membrane protein YckC
MTLILKRIAAYFIDYMVILTYAAILFGVTFLSYRLRDLPMEPVSPLKGNLISFFTLTVPVFLYFYLFESGKFKGSLGKKLLNIQIHNNSKKNVFCRVFFKIIPWEIAHVGIHWSVYYSNQGQEIPLWNWILNILPQIIVLGYFISIILTKGRSSIYDKVARTFIQKKKIPSY